MVLNIKYVTYIKGTKGCKNFSSSFLTSADFVFENAIFSYDDYFFFSFTNPTIAIILSTIHATPSGMAQISNTVGISIK